MQKLPIKIAIAVFLTVCLYWLGSASSQWWSSDESAGQDMSAESVGSDQLVSSIQPISDADANERGAVQGSLEETLKHPSDASERVLAERFSEVNQLINLGKREVAILELESLTREYPRVIEPYINLAAMYAASNQLNLASSALDKGMQANPNTAALFKSVQTVYGAKAANAYRLALGKDLSADQNVAAQKLDLPTIASLDTRQAQQNIIATLRAELSEAQTGNASLRASYEKSHSSNQADKDNNDNLKTALQEQQSLVVALQSKVMKAEQELLSLQATHTSELDSLREQLIQQTTLANAAQMRQQELLSNKQQQAAAKASRLQAEREELAAKQERERLAQLAKNQQGNDQKAQLNKAATDLVKSWAASWVAQNVAEYITHYSNDYTPVGSSISHPQWREQRRVRLTNKKFIQVSVSDFSVVDQGDRFAVSFTQHYRSNTVDDRIRKLLVFAKSANGISNSKIVAEAVI
jgi:DNA repair exonuclease SbcCD ATPase subunit